MKIYEYNENPDGAKLLTSIEDLILGYPALYLTNDEKIIKIFGNDLIQVLELSDYNLKRFIMEGSELVKTKEVVTPNGIILENEKFKGYSVPFIEGESLEKHLEKNRTIEEKIRLFKELERIIKENDNLVFPDISSAGNIMVTKENEIRLIDFDGMQVDDFKSISISRNVMPFKTTIKHGSLVYDWDNETLLEKYYKNVNKSLFTKELDIKSLYFIFLKECFHIDLNECIDNIEYSKDIKINKLKRRIEEGNFEIDDDFLERIVLLMEEESKNEYPEESIQKVLEKNIRQISSLQLKKYYW